MNLDFLLNFLVFFGMYSDSSKKNMSSSGNFGKFLRVYFLEMEHDRSSFSRFLTVFFLFFTELDDYPGGIDAGDVFDPSHVPSPVMARHIRRLSECPGDYSGAEMESFDSGVCDVCSPVTTTSVCDSSTGRGGPSGNTNAQTSGSFSARNPISVFKTGSNGSTQSSQRKSKKQFMTLAQVILFFHNYYQSLKIFKSINQSTSQSINQSINQSIEQSINRTINQSINTSNLSNNQSINTSNLSNNQSINQYVLFKCLVILFVCFLSSFFCSVFQKTFDWGRSFFSFFCLGAVEFGHVFSSGEIPAENRLPSAGEISRRLDERDWREEAVEKTTGRLQIVRQIFSSIFSNDFFYIFHCLKK